MLFQRMRNTKLQESEIVDFGSISPVAEHIKRTLV